jgi:hypothetical protein
MAGFCEQGSELSGSIKTGNFLTRERQHLKMTRLLVVNLVFLFVVYLTTLFVCQTI